MATRTSRSETTRSAAAVEKDPAAAGSPPPGETAPVSVGAEFRSAAQALASVLGLAGYVYLIGGIVSWVRFGAARLPSDVATSALSHSQLFEVGFRSIIFMALAFTLLCGVAYLAGSPRWSANQGDWHELITQGGIRKARERRASPDAAEAWSAHRTVAIHTNRARRATRIASAAHVVHFTWLENRANKVHHNSEATVTKYQGKAKAHPQAPRAALGDPAVRVLAGFNTLVLSAVFGLGVARLVEFLFPTAWWAILLAWGLAAVFAHWLLVRWGPLKWGPRIHAFAWIIVLVVGLFVGAPLGLLLIAGLVISLLGRPLARVNRPGSAAELLRSPLPWALFTFYLLVGLSYVATPPATFQRAVVTTASGQRVGGFVGRDASGLYLATCTPLADATSSNERVLFINSADLKQVSLGGKERLDSGQRPSLVGIAMQALGINAQPPTWFNVDLRARSAACVGGRPASLTIGREAPALGVGVIAGPGPPGGQAHDGEAPIEQTSPPGIARLARLYQPTLEVTVADRFWPVSVGAVINDVNPSNGQRTALCHVITKQITCQTVTSLSALTPTGSRSSDYLRLPAALRSDPNNQFEAFENGQSVRPGTLHHWLANPDVLDPWYTAQVYFYYAGPISSSRWPARPANPDVMSGLIGLEYWFYYPFNYYPTAVGSELMQDAPLAGDETNTDLHQGDWEHVAVLLDPKTLRPQWLYMARHADEGQFYPWTSPSLAFDGTHPIIQGAFGGHPSYDSHCGARLRARVYNLSSDWVICGSGRFAFRAATTPLVDLAQTTWDCWKGHFGEAKPGLEVNHTAEADNVVSQAREFVFVAGPISPLWQAELGSLGNKTGPCAGAGPKAAEMSASAFVARTLSTTGAPVRTRSKG